MVLYRWILYIWRWQIAQLLFELLHTSFIRIYCELLHLKFRNENENQWVCCVCVCGYIFRSSNEMFRFNWTELMFSALIKETNSELAFSHERFDLVTQTKDKRQSAPMKLIFLQWICCVLPAACLFHAIFHRSGVLMKYLRTMHWLVMRSLIPRSKCYSLHNNNR